MEENTNNNLLDKLKKYKKPIIIIAFILLLIVVFYLGKMSNSNNLNDSQVTNEINTSDDTNTTEDEKKSKSKEKSSKESEGKMYNLLKLYDQNAGVNVFDAFLPQGWQAQAQGNWQVVSPDFPGTESITIVSPDGKAAIYIDSIQQFGDSTTQAEGVNLEYYTTYLHYMDADTFVQYYMDTAHPGSTLIKDFEDDPDILSNANQLNQLFIQKFKNTTSQFSGMGYGFDVVAVNPTMSKRQYKVDNGYLEGTAVVIGQTNTISSSFYSQTTTYWDIPYSIIYFAQDKETFDKYYDDYNTIIANSSYTNDFYAMVEYVASCIANVVTGQAAAKSQASLDAMNSYIDSNYSSSSSESTNEKVMEMWDDVINEVDKYQTLDGSSIKTSIHNDVVAQSGDSFYVGTKAGIPEGYTELEKGY